ncbi:hypothetical protein KAFR_0A03090 [Kazachstania africana CBS 2517]|uniref:Pyridoxamine 5'-phosphate oxidase N-terminal domain-containing protein n=1 Tax=Kazachstania africana (strain ATCC 22294 / BCRC 22015 / CBS 2517 / CECT 1963 / NBRC 1671 / NRRL Y-8276) TaxID=1071382 RepID=H2AMZ4_KAZAF|nr:hypothetical protein KAFR_0A03090 [Kazachstania africana CBS 2517]CCF55744.1 hypothetical protein KAFR_0A03090 [Kazachstania africana CBS 2517]
MSTVDKFPRGLIDLIKVSKYVHVATCSSSCVPSVSLMNYIYISSSDSFDPTDNNDYVIFATSRHSEKYENMLANPTISLLFHDWLAANSLTPKKATAPSPSSPSSSNNARFVNLLQDLTEGELNQISASIRGVAEIINPLGQESKYYKRLLLRANPDADVFILGSDTVLIKVKMRSAKVSDIDNNTNIYI